MDDPFYRSRGKRSYPYHEREHSETNGSRKKFISDDAFSGPLAPLLKLTPGETVFRLLCPEPKVGCVIGKGGSIVKNMRHETGAKITIADYIEGAEERVILISSSERDWDRVREKERGRQSDRDRDGRNTRGMPPAQEALMKVHARIVEGSESNTPGEDPQAQGFTTRLLVPNSQVGSLLGKGGHIIERMRQESKTQIRILPRDQAPYCSMPSDEIVQIVGSAEAVTKALRLVSTQLVENPPRERHPAASRSPSRSVFRPEDTSSPYQQSLNLPGGYNAGQQPGQHPTAYPDHRTGAGHIGGHVLASSNVLTNDRWEVPPSKDELVFRILCPKEKIGGIIGKGGSIVRTLEDEIGVNIKVCGAVAGSDERVVMVSSVEHSDDNISPAQEALLHVQTKIADLGPDEDAVITTRLLVSSSQVGCLLGKGGSIIAEIRRLTGANIRILGNDDLPPCASPTDELVQIVGDIRHAREALVQVTKRLRSNLYYEKSLLSLEGAPPLGNSTPQKRPDYVSPGRMDFPVSGAPSAIQSAPSYGSSSPPGYWVGQNLLGGSGRPDFDSPLLRREADLFRTTGALVTKTTVEVLIPSRVVGPIFGDGSNMVHIRQMSGAKINLLDAKPGAAEAIVEISGTPEQTHSAQSMLQALVLRGQTASLDYTV